MSRKKCRPKVYPKEEEKLNFKIVYVLWAPGIDGVVEENRRLKTSGEEYKNQTEKDVELSNGNHT